MSRSMMSREPAPAFSVPSPTVTTGTPWSSSGARPPSGLMPVFDAKSEIMMIRADLPARPAPAASGPRASPCPDRRGAPLGSALAVRSPSLAPRRSRRTRRTWRRGPGPSSLACLARLLERLAGDRPARLAAAPRRRCSCWCCRRPGRSATACCFFFSLSVTEGRSAASRQSRIASSRSESATHRQPPLVPLEPPPVGPERQPVTDADHARSGPARGRSG